MTFSNDVYNFKSLILKRTAVAGRVYFLKKPVPRPLFEAGGSFLKLFTSVYGLGVVTAKRLCAFMGVSPYASLNVFSAKVLQRHLKSAEAFLDEVGFIGEAELKKQAQRAVDFKIKHGFVRGVRISQHLPARGQRSKTNAGTSKKLRLAKQQ